MQMCNIIAVITAITGTVPQITTAHKVNKETNSNSQGAKYAHVIYIHSLSSCCRLTMWLKSTQLQKSVAIEAIGSRKRLLISHHTFLILGHVIQPDSQTG